MHVFARNLCEKVGIDKPILLSLALKDESLPTLRAIEELILEHKVWWSSTWLEELHGKSVILDELRFLSGCTRQTIIIRKYAFRNLHIIPVMQDKM